MSRLLVQVTDELTKDCLFFNKCMIHSNVGHHNDELCFHSHLVALNILIK